MFAGDTSTDSIEFMFAGVDGQVEPRHMDEIVSPSFFVSGSAMATLKGLLSPDDKSDVSTHTMTVQNLEAQPWLGALAAAVPNSSCYRRELIAAQLSVALSSLRVFNFESGYLAALDAAYYALDDGLESDWALGSENSEGLGFRNSQSDAQLSGSAVAVAAAASAAGIVCSRVRSDDRSVSSLTASAKRILCPDPHPNIANQHSFTAAPAVVSDCDGVQSSVFSLVRMILDSRDFKQRCEASYAISSLVRQISRISLPLQPKRPVVALLACATGGYKQFISPMIASARKHFLASCCDLKFVIFTDNTQHEALQQDGVVALPRNHGGWPDASLGRTASYLAHAQEYSWADYVFATDVDVKFTRAIGSEILGRTVGTLHADNAYYRGDERTGHNTVGCFACCVY